jgi:hypothetical protein
LLCLLFDSLHQGEKDSKTDLELSKWLIVSWFILVEKILLFC